MLELNPNLPVPTKYPPNIPIVSPTATNIGIATVAANNRGATRYFIGLVDNVTKASICSVTLIVPNSAAIDDETLPATINPPNTGPSSLTMPIATIEGTTLSALKRAPPE